MTAHSATAKECCLLVLNSVTSTPSEDEFLQIERLITTKAEMLLLGVDRMGLRNFFVSAPNKQNISQIGTEPSTQS
jgi:hypothetical protein